MTAFLNCWKLSFEDLIAVGVIDCLTSFAQETAFFRTISLKKKNSRFFLLFQKYGTAVAQTSINKRYTFGLLIINRKKIVGSIVGI